MAVGASTAVTGLVAGGIALLLVNWKEFDKYPQFQQTRCWILIFLVYMLIVNVGGAFGAGSAFDPTDKTKPGASVDWAGHGGGAIAGLLWGLAVLPRADTPYGKKLKLWGRALTVSWFVLFLLLLFTNKKN